MKTYSPAMISVCMTFLILFLLPVGSARTQEPKAVTPFAVLMKDLHETMITALLKNYPPNSPFTLALVFDDLEDVFKPFPPAVEKRLLAIEGVNAAWFVPSDELALPFGQKAQKQPDGSVILPGVTKRGTDQRVAVYSVDCLNWHSGEEILVHWSISSGPLAGGGGRSMLRFNDGRWTHVRVLSRAEY